MATDSTINEIVKSLEKFDVALTKGKDSVQHVELESSWQSLDAVGEAVYSADKNPTFDSSFISNIREHTQHFTGNLPPSQFQQQTAAPAFYLALTQQTPPSYLFKINNDSGELGWSNPLPFHDMPNVNDDICSYQERLNHLSASGLIEQLTKHCNILEIGGGFGALAHAIKQLKKQSRYVILDLPTSLKYSYSWLTLQGYKCELISDINDKSKLLIKNVDFFLVNCEAKAVLDDIDFDLAINTLSFTEMPYDIVDDYGLFLQQRLALKQGVLFEQNNEYPQHLGTDKTCSTALVFNQYFSQHHLISVCSMLGKVRLWTNNPSPIYQPQLSQRFSPKEYDIALFGASYLGDVISNEFYSPTDILCFYDNDENKWGTTKHGITIFSPENIATHLASSHSKGKQFIIIITSRFYHAIYQQLDDFKPYVKFINELDMLK